MEAGEILLASLWNCMLRLTMFTTSWDVCRERNKPSKLKQKGPLLLKALLVRKEAALRVSSGCLELLETSKRASCGRK